MFLQKRSICQIIFILTVIFLSFYYYYGIFHYHYLVPSGDDSMRHMTEAQVVWQNGNFQATSSSLDPPIFHILLAILSHFTKTTIASFTLFFAPFLAIFASLSLYFLFRRLFKSDFLAALSPIFLVIFSPQPANIYDGGTYLNIFAAFCLMLFGLATLPKLFLEKEIAWKNVILSALFFGTVMFSHSLSMTYFVLIFLILLVFLLVVNFTGFIVKFLNSQQVEASKFGSPNLFGVEKIYFKNFLLICLILVLFSPFTWQYYSKFSFKKITQPISEFFIEEKGPVLEIPQPSQFNYIPSFGYYGRAVGKVIWGLSLIFLPFVCILKIKRTPKFAVPENEKKLFPLILVFTWALALFFGSRFEFFVLPLRFGRDLVVPLVCIVIISLFYYLNYLRSKKIIQYLIIFLLIFALPNYFVKAVRYNNMVRLQKSDKEAISWILQNTKKDDVILVYPPTLTMGDWGSYVNLLTKRKTVDGEDCKIDFSVKSKYKKCNQIFKPNSGKSKKFYLDNSIDYVYAGKKILGHYAGEKRIDWEYQGYLSKAKFLKKVVEFPENAELGKVVIFKVEQKKLFR